MTKDINLIFVTAQELPPAERPAYLTKACAGDDEVRARVERMLAIANQAESFFTTGVPGAASEEPKPVGEAIKTIMVDPHDAPQENIGQKIGRYKILECVGEGGCGVVYVAEQTEPVRRRVALKVIKMGMDTKQVVARFEAERQALARMEHPNIAKVLDAGATETGRPYFIMELVRGIKITDYCDQANLTTKERLELFIKVCQAIQHAHQKGVIHRDIKPSNILVTINDGVPVPKVIDFGIAKATEGRLTDATIYTQLHQFIGTPAYMSPEQAEMSSLDIDTRSDIYSLGVLLYELLIGQTPFDVKELMSQGLDAMRRTIREVEPNRPSTRLATLSNKELTTAAKRRSVPAQQLQNQLQGDLDWIVMKALEKDRMRRYDTANGLASDIQRHLKNEPVIARPSSMGYRVGKAVRRNKLAFAAVTAVAASLVVGIAVSISEAARAEREAALARAAQQQAVAETARATAAEKKTSETLKQVVAERDAKELARQDAVAVSKFMAGVFQSPDPERDGRTITVLETLDRAATNLEHELAAQPAVRAQLQAELGRTYGTLGLYREAIPLLEKAHDYALKTYGLEHGNTLGTMNGLANCYFYADRRDEALKMREEALTLDRKVFGPESPETFGAMGNLSTSYFYAGRRDEALKLREELLALARKAFGPENPTTLMAMGTLANSYAESDRKDEALKLFEELFALARKALGPEHPVTVRTMANLASSYSRAGRKDEALKLREEALPLDRKVLGPQHPDTLSAIVALADSYNEAGRRHEALKLLEEVLPIARKVLGPDHPDTLAAMTELAWTLATSDAATIRNGTNAVQLAEATVAATSRQNPDYLDTLAAAYAETQQFDKAVAVEHEAIALYQTEPQKKEAGLHLSLYQGNKPCREQKNP